ncbi:MAG: septum site-determining protein Ssd [Nocardioidaceae bacterium]
MAPPLIVTSDDVLLDELVRLAAAAGVTPEVAPDAGIGLRSWAAAPVVLLGHDQAAAMCRLAPPRREAVHLVTWAAQGSGELLRLALRLGVTEVVELPTAAAWLVERLTDLDDLDAGTGRVIGVVGGSGGAGATTFSCALGQVAAAAGPALVVDADAQGPGLDRVLGVEDAAGVRWHDLQHARGRLSSRSLREAVPARDRLGVLTWSPTALDGPPMDAVREVLSAGRRGHDVVVVDLPRAGDAMTEELVARCDELVVVSRPTVLGLAATARLCSRHPTVSRCVVVRGRGPAESEVAAVTGVDRVVVMPDQRRLDELVDLGAGPVPGRRGPLWRAARAVLGDARRRETR